MVLEAAQHFFDSATSLEAEEIGLGQVALSLLPQDPEVQQQGMCLQALQELQDYGLHLLPADYNQVRHAVAVLYYDLRGTSFEKGNTFCLAWLCCMGCLLMLGSDMRLLLHKKFSLWLSDGHILTEPSSSMTPALLVLELIYPDK